MRHCIKLRHDEMNRWIWQVIWWYIYIEAADEDVKHIHVFMIFGFKKHLLDKITIIISWAVKLNSEWWHQNNSSHYGLRFDRMVHAAVCLFFFLQLHNVYIMIETTGIFHCRDVTCYIYIYRISRNFKECIYNFHLKIEYLI